MKKILIQVKDQKLYIKIKKHLNTEQKNLLNTNIISQNELVFSDQYIKENQNIFTIFLKELVNNYNIDTLVIRENTVAGLILDTIKNIASITRLYLREESVLTYELCQKIIDTNTIKILNVYNLPAYLLDMLDKEKITVYSRCEMLFQSNFMKDNKLETYSHVFYKKNIEINLPMNEQDRIDFKSFLNINNYLKVININKVHKNDLELIIDLLNKQKLKNIKLNIKDNIKDVEVIEYLKKLNKENQKNNIQLKIDYSKDYINNNLIDQINLNTFKLCIFVALILVSVAICFIFYNNYSSMKEVDHIKEDIFKVIAEYKEEHPQDEEIDDNIEVDNDNLDVDEPEFEISNMEIASLLAINEHTVGWLKVNNTNVDYPVVQYSDNEYYLNKNFYQEKNSSGWIFMDYRADNKYLSKNTIIFGHNMYYSGVMFGTLYKTKYSSWYTNEENQIIEFDTLYKKMKWKIFSIYVTNVTSDYLIADFSSTDKFREFLHLITDRSIYNFNTPVSSSDKILTLSTCSNNGQKRLVIHAVLLDE